MVESSKEEIKSNKKRESFNDANMVQATKDDELIIDTSEALEIVTSFD